MTKAKKKSDWKCCTSNSHADTGRYTSGLHNHAPGTNGAKAAIYAGSVEHGPQHPTNRRSQYKRPGVPR